MCTDYVMGLMQALCRTENTEDTLKGLFTQILVPSRCRYNKISGRFNPVRPDFFRLPGWLCGAASSFQRQTSSPAFWTRCGSRGSEEQPPDMDRTHPAWEAASHALTASCRSIPVARALGTWSFYMRFMCFLRLDNVNYLQLDLT